MPEPGYPNNETWFQDHFDKAAGEIIQFFADAGLPLEGRRIADVGTGDGLIALGLFVHARPQLLAAFDVEETDVEQLKTWAKENGIDELPSGLRFYTSQHDHVPAPDAFFDRVVSWSAFEHIRDPAGMAREIRRILTPDGVAMIQLFPFYYSEWGGHGWAAPPFDHLIHSPVRDDLYFNRVTIDTLHEALREGGLRTVRVELIHNTFNLPPQLLDYRLSDLAIGGVKILAYPI